MDVRPALVRDIPGMHRVRMSVTENALRDVTRVRPEHYRQMLREHGRGWVCEVEGRVVGFAVADLTRSNIWALFVEPGYESRGVGRRLHDTMLDWLFDSGAPHVWLSTDHGTRAQRFYQAAGWRYAGTEPNGEARFEMTSESWRQIRSGSQR